MRHHRYLGTTHFFNFTLLTRVALNHQCVCVENHRELVRGGPSCVVMMMMVTITMMKIMMMMMMTNGILSISCWCACDQNSRSGGPGLKVASASVLTLALVSQFNSCSKSPVLVIRSSPDPYWENGPGINSRNSVQMYFSEQSTQ